MTSRPSLQRRRRYRLAWAGSDDPRTFELTWVRRSRDSGMTMIMRQGKRGIFSCRFRMTRLLWSRRNVVFLCHSQLL
jgi:hypothetical protein